MCCQGKVPVNEYGNVEVFQPWMLPEGTVQIRGLLWLWYGNEGGQAYSHLALRLLIGLNELHLMIRSSLCRFCVLDLCLILCSPSEIIKNPNY